MPDRHSTPASPSATQRATNGVPVLARGGGELDAAVRLALRDARREHAHDRARPAVVGDHEVGATGDEQHVAAAHGRDQLVLAARLDDGAGGPAEPQRGQLTEIHGPRD